MTLLPNIPSFIYGDTTLNFTLPCMPWIRSLRAVGGDIEADSGTRAGFIVHRDELLTLTLRFHENEWVDIQPFIDFGQTGTPFLWFPDQNDLTVSFTVCLDAPASGATFRTELDDGLPRIQKVTITIVEPGIPGTPWQGLPAFERRIPVVPPAPLQPIRLEIDPQIDPFDEGDPALQLDWFFYDFQGTLLPDKVPTSWESDNPGAATVDSGGLVTPGDGLPFVLLHDNEFTDLPWMNAGDPVEDAGLIHGTSFWRVFSTSAPKQFFSPAPEFDGQDYFATVFIRPDGEDETDIPTGTFEGAIVDVTDNIDVARWRFTITPTGAIALTLVTGVLIRNCTLTDLTKAFTFKASALDMAHGYEFRLRDTGTAASLLCAHAIVTAQFDAVTAIIAKYDVGHTHLVSNSSIQFVDDETVSIHIPDDPPDTPVHLTGTFFLVGVGGGGGGSSGCGGGGGQVASVVVSIDADIDWIIGARGNEGAPTGSGGSQTSVSTLGIGGGTILLAPGGGGAGSEHGGSSGLKLGGAVLGLGCGLHGGAGGGGGGAGSAGNGHDSQILSPCIGCFILAGGGGDGSPILYDHRIIAILGPGGGGGATFEGSCGAERGAPGFVGGGLGGFNSFGEEGADTLGAGGGNGAKGTRGQLIIIFRPSDGHITGL